MAGSKKTRKKSSGRDAKHRAGKEGLILKDLHARGDQKVRGGYPVIIKGTQQSQAN